MKTVIIGAGLAGLTVGYRIGDAQVYEARGRVGGRVLSAVVNGHSVELGGQNIDDGGSAIYLRRLIEEFGLETVSNRFGLDVSYFEGEQKCSEKEALAKCELDPESLGELAEGCTTMDEVLEKLFGRDHPLFTTFGVRLSAYEGGDLKKMSVTNIDTLYYMLKGGLSPVHQDDIALTSVKGGNSRLAEALAKSLGERLHLNSPLRAIHKGKRFELHFEDEVVFADRVVLAVPAAVYQDIEFGLGVIPAQRLEAMCAMEYGKNAKILVPAPEGRERLSFINERLVAWNDLSCGMITMYYTGAASRFDSKTIEERYREDLSMVERGYAWSAPESVELACDQMGVEYSGPVGYSWPNDRYARGSYTYVAAGQEGAMLDMVEVDGVRVKKLFEPVDGLYFAGEHASTEVDAIGTMEAAVESGENVARLLR